MDRLKPTIDNKLYSSGRTLKKEEFYFRFKNQLREVMVISHPTCDVLATSNFSLI